MAMWAWVAVTDWLDGALARAWNQGSALGRVLDPLADKVAVLGTLVCLLPAGMSGGYLQPWMVALVIAREFVITALRGEMERRGVPFGADWLGKLKMVAQVAVIWLALAGEWLGPSSRPGWLEPALVASVWTMLAAAVASGIQYGFKAFLRGGGKTP